MKSIGEGRREDGHVMGVMAGDEAGDTIAGTMVDAIESKDIVIGGGLFKLPTLILQLLLSTKVVVVDVEGILRLPLLLLLQFLTSTFRECDKVKSGATTQDSLFSSLWTKFFMFSTTEGDGDGLGVADSLTSWGGGVASTFIFATVVLSTIAGLTLFLLLLLTRLFSTHVSIS